MTLHLNLSGSHHRNAEQQAELREARRLLRDKVRDDWEYPPLPAWKSSGQKEAATAPEDAAERVAGFKFHTPSSLERTHGVVGEALGLGFEPNEWRERDWSPDASDAELDGEAGSTSAKPSSKSNESVYKFDAPDSVGAQLSDRRQARKRKRHQAIRKEMEWNDGLAHWTRRRDVWCCARQTREVRLLEGSAVDQLEPEEVDSRENESITASVGSSARTSTSSSVDHQDLSTPQTTPSVSPDVSKTEASTPALIIPLDVLVPIAPPLLPNHPVRRRINSNMYPEIYNKIILQSRTPSIPINLATLINALVKGWKDDGEWPPKAGQLEKSLGRKKGAEGSLRQGVKAVGRVLRLTGVMEHG